MNKTIVSKVAASGPIYEDILVSPELAQAWLGLNTSNRKVKPGEIAAFVNDMRNGRWVLNGETIKLAGTQSKPTKLLDGQNRLFAIMRAQTSVKMTVCFGLPESSQVTMDSGAKRTVSDNLHIQGVSNANVVAAAAALALRVASGRINGGPTPYTNAAAEEFILENPDLFRSAAVAMQYARKTDIPASLVAYTHWVFSSLDLDAATGFWRDASEKVGLPAGDPVIALTNLFANARRQSQRIHPSQGLSAIYRAWNYRRDGQPLRVVRLASPGPTGTVPTPDPH